MPKPSRQLRPQDIDALEVMEGKILYVYDDAVWPTRMWKRGERIRGNLTAGVGHLLSNPKTKAIYPEAEKWIGKAIPESQVEAWLDADNDASENRVGRLVKVPLNDNQFATMTFFDFNVGGAAFEASTLLRKLNAGQYDAVPGELRKWVNTTIDGKKVRSDGLIKRRSEEIAYWMAAPSKAPVPIPRPAGLPTGTQVGEKEPTGLAALLNLLLNLVGAIFKRRG